MASSTKRPNERSKEKVARKDKAIPVVFITMKVIKKVIGIESIETIAWRIPKKSKRTKKTKAITIVMSL